jgi:ATP-binding cassette, subfamily B, bacterial
MSIKPTIDNLKSKSRRSSDWKPPFFGHDEPAQKKLRLAHLRWMRPYIKGHWRMGVIGVIGMIIVSLLSLPAPYLTKIIIDKAIVGKDLRLLNTVILAMFGVQFLLLGTSWTTNYFFNRFSLEIMTRIKRDLFHRILRLPMSFFAQHQTGYIMSRVGEVEGLNFFFSSTLINVVISIARFVFCLGILIHLNAKLTLIALLFLPFLFWITRWFSKYLRRISWQYYEKSAVISRGMQDSLSGIEVVKTFGAETREAEKFQLHLNGLKDMNIRRMVLMSLYSESLSLIGAGVGFIILWWSGWNIILGRFTLGSYLAFSAYFAQLFGPTQMLANLGFMLQPAKVALHRIRELLQIDAEDESGRTRTISSLKGKIEVCDVYFEYEAAKPVFSKVSLGIGAGEKILIAGPNGSGKSTLVKLIMGFYSPQKGEILFDGQPLHDISPVSLRERISIVSQNTFLFSDTVRNNVLYSAPDATDEELEDAMRLSGAIEFVRGMQQGMDTEIGERGVRLSGGERQKLSIARAILRKSDLIIFDEATTHLDDSSVLLLRDLMKNRFADKTCLVISHRPIEIPVIDRVYWIERGSIREMNTPAACSEGRDSA